MPVTIKEIAALANVSRGTVDKVLNNRPGVEDLYPEKKFLKLQLNYIISPILLGKLWFTVIILLNLELFLHLTITHLFRSSLLESIMHRKNFLLLVSKLLQK